MGNFVPHKAKPSGGSHCGREEVLLRDHVQQGIKNDRRMVSCLWAIKLVKQKMRAETIVTDVRTSGYAGRFELTDKVMSLDEKKCFRFL